MRTPKGLNSRDDGDDDFIEKSPSSTVKEGRRRLHEEVDPMIGNMLTVARDFDHYLSEIYSDLDESSETGTVLTHRGVNALEAMQNRVDMLIRHLSMLDAGLRRMPG